MVKTTALMRSSYWPVILTTRLLEVSLCEVRSRRRWVDQTAAEKVKGSSYESVGDGILNQIHLLIAEPSSD